MFKDSTVFLGDPFQCLPIIPIHVWMEFSGFSLCPWILPIGGHFWEKCCSLLFFLSHQVLIHGDMISLNLLSSRLNSLVSQLVLLWEVLQFPHDLCGPVLDLLWYVYDCPVLMGLELFPAPRYVSWALVEGKCHLLDLVAVLSWVEHPKGAVGHLCCSGTFPAFCGMTVHTVGRKKKVFPGGFQTAKWDGWSNEAHHSPARSSFTFLYVSITTEITKIVFLI